MNFVALTIFVLYPICLYGLLLHTGDAEDVTEIKGLVQNILCSLITILIILGGLISR